MTIQKISLGLDVAGVNSGRGGDSARVMSDKINNNFSNQSHAASRLVGIEPEQLPTTTDVRNLIKPTKRAYATLADATSDRVNIVSGSFVEVNSDANDNNNRTYRYTGSAFLAVKKISAYIKEVEDTPLMYAVIDADGYLTDIQLDEDGKIPTRVIKDWATRMTPYLNISTSPPVVLPPQASKPKLDLAHMLPIPISTKTTTLHLADTHHKNGELLPVMPDINRVIIIGSSSAQKSAGYIETEFKKINPQLQVYAPAYSGATIEAQEPWVGSLPLLLTFSGNTINKSGDSLVAVSPNISTSAYVNGITGWVMGVKGSIRASAGKFYFTRAVVAASNSTAPSSVPFIPERGNAFRNAVQVLWLGKNNLTSTNNAENDVDMLMDKTDRVIDYSASLVKRTIVMTHYADTDEPATSAVRDRINRCNALYKLRYRDNVFDAESYLLGAQIFTDLGITRTQADINAQAIGNLAPSLAADRVHATNAVYQYLAARLREFVAARKYLEI